MELPLGPEPLQLFIGANGAGKTSLLASAAVLLSRFVGASPEHRGPQLRAVRSAIYRLMPEFSNLRVRRAPLRMEVHKQLGPQESIPLSVAQLSDGEKDLMATVGDLAMRLALANPGRADPLTGQGLVLWDEFGLHMHPRWQSLAARLPEVFPGCQLLMTSHSPTLLSHAKEARAHLLEQTGSGVRCVAVEHPYGMDVNRILEEIMGAPVRPVEIRQRIDQLFLLLDKKQLHQALAMQAPPAPLSSFLPALCYALRSRQ